MRLGDGLGAIGGLADDLEATLLLEQTGERAPEQGVIVDDQDADLPVRHHERPRGSSTPSRVPWPGTLRTLRRPPTASARSRMLFSPKCSPSPDASSARNPMPSS